MNQLPTTSRILDAAEKLFGKHGFDGTSIKAICAEADANVAAVHYHFKNKDDLAMAVMARRMEGVARRRKELLDALLGESDQAPPIRGIVETIVLPLVEIIASEGAAGRAYVKTLAHLIHERLDLLSTTHNTYNGTNASRQLEALYRALPGVPQGVVQYRLALSYDAALHWLAHPLQLTQEGPYVRPQRSSDDYTVELIDFLAGGLAVEPTTAEDAVSGAPSAI